MNFWCFLVTPDDQHIITSSISASAASVLQHHWCINTNSISVSAESLHQQHTCIISISTSVASLHQQRHCISSVTASAHTHISSISTSSASVHQQRNCISRISTSVEYLHQQHQCISRILTSAVCPSRLYLIRVLVLYEHLRKNARIMLAFFLFRAPSTRCELLESVQSYGNNSAM